MFPVVFVTFSALFILNFFVFVVFLEDIKKESVSSYFRVTRITTIVLLGELNILNFLLIFIPQKYLGELVLVAILNLVLLLYFFCDLFYLSQRKREYILWLQSIVFSQCKLKDIFELKENDGGDYKEMKAFPQQRCSIVKKANEEYECIKIGSENPVYFVPKYELSMDTLMFYCLKIELDWDKKDEVKLFSGNINSIAFKEYDNEKLREPYFFIKNKLLSKKGIATIKRVGIALIISFFVVLSICEIIGIDIVTWVAIII